MTDDPLVFDRRLLFRRRDRAAPSFRDHAFLVERAAEDILERLGAVRRTFPVAVNLGAYNGLLGRRLRGMAGIEFVVDTEPSAGLLAQCDGAKVRADEETLPFGEGTVDLVVSALALQFVNDLPGTLVQIRRVLKPDGLLLATLLGGATLQELRTSLLAAEAEVEGGASPRVAPFADVRDLGTLLQRAQLALPVVDSETVIVTYPGPLQLMHELRAMGASNALQARRRLPLRKRTLHRAMETYVERFGLGDGRVPATFEFITMTAWAPHESQQKPLQPGSARARLADALGTREMPAGESVPQGKGPR